MPEQKANPQEPPQRGLFETAKRAAMGALFFLILFIPRLRRLRRRVWAWSLVRVIAVLSGGVLIWHYTRAQAGAGFLLGGLVLIALGVLVRDKPQAKTTEEKARELGALVVLNGGTFLAASGAEHPDVQIFVFPERLLVLDGREEAVGEISLARLQHYAAHPASSEAVEEGKPWELEIAGESASARFRYEGFFAEHLARVAETTLGNLLRKELPVLKS
jgi:hypothetical protein